MLEYVYRLIIQYTIASPVQILGFFGTRSRMTSDPRPYEKCEKINKSMTLEELDIQERVEYYDTWAETYDVDFELYGYAGPDITVEYLKRYFQDRGGIYLDCGAGTGLLGVHIKSLGYTNFHALDASSQSLEKAKSREAYSNFIQEYITTGRLSIDTDVYDGLVCCGCLSPGNVEPDCVEDWCRIVKPGGIIIMVMNQRWLSKEQGYNAEGAFQKRVDDGKWESVVREQRDGYISDDVAEIFVFRVK